MHLGLSHHCLGSARDLLRGSEEGHSIRTSATLKHAREVLYTDAASVVSG